ncbi:alpha-acetolactate decarboxylase, partial [Pantoea agglomerans]|nr:alpha-acetolactate decarboxylase [Pantoea agglomerans]
MSNCVTDCSCEDQLKHTVLTLSQDAPESVIYQTSLMSALLSGVYDGNVRIAD